ncbi:phosphoglycerate kinase [Patescibacteria group bacterium]
MVKSIQNADIQPQTKVFIRYDLDIKSNTFRLDRGLSTLKLILEKGGFPIIAGHRGKNKSTSDLKPYFDKHLGQGNYELLENLRFDIREEQNSKEFAKELVQKAEVYVNECFATSHREHTSIVTLPKLLPSFAGLNLLQELNTMDYVLNASEKPLIVVIGGAKIESKLPVVTKFLETADSVLLGGRVALEWKEKTPKNLILPKDYKDNKDIGDETIKEFLQIIQKARTIVWGGPMGMYENPNYAKGTVEIAKAISESGGFSVIGGGDTIEAVDQLGLLGEIDFVSAGGGAMLKYLAEGNLVGIEALK